MPFTTPLTVEESPDRDGCWVLTSDLKYAGKKDSFVVPCGFETNFASVPRPLTWLVPASGVYSKAAVLHDWLCGEPTISRYDADGIFRRSMRELGVSDLRRYVMWSAVRLGAGLGSSGLAERLVIGLLGLLSVALAAVLCWNPSLPVGVALGITFVTGVVLIPKGSSIAERLLIGLLVALVFILAIVPSTLVVLNLLLTYTMELVIVSVGRVFGREVTKSYRFWWT